MSASSEVMGSAASVDADAPAGIDADASAVAPGAADRPATRGRRQAPLLRIRGPLSLRWRLILGAGGVAFVVVVLLAASLSLEGDSFLVPTPAATWDALVKMWSDGVLVDDLRASTQRIAIGYAISMVIGVVIGIAIGSFSSAEAFFEPQVGFLRYIPASALTPLFLLWLGIGESPKITLIVVGTVFFNVLMVADVARAVPRELLNASATLGAGRWT